MTDTDALVEEIAKAMFVRPFRDGPVQLSVAVPSWGGVGAHKREEFRNHARAALSAIEAAGWRVVPVEPTQEMIEAGLEGEVVRDSSGTSWRSPTAYVYSAMLSAAPRIGEK